MSSPARWVYARAFDPGLPEADCAYNAAYFGRDGRLYFSIGTHRIDSHAWLGCFEPKSDKVVFVKNLGAALKEDSGLMVPQGKVHVPLAEVDGRLYVATMQGYYQSDRKNRGVYPGFRIMGIDIRSGRLTDLVRGPEEEGLIAGVLDPERRVYYGLTYPSGLFCRYDLRSGALQISARPCSDKPASVRYHQRPIYPICRSLGLDANGVVYGSCRDGSIWHCEPGGSPQTLSGLNVLQGAVPPIDRKGALDSNWRVVLWNREDECFYGLHAGTQSLFRFDPFRRLIEPLCRFGVRASHDVGHSRFKSQLGLTLGCGRMLYHIAHGPPAARQGQRTVRRSGYITSYDLDRRAFEEHGAIRLETGERVIFAESLAADPLKNLYTMAWVEVTEPDLLPLYRRLRSQASNGECQGEIYRMMLLRISTDQLKGDA